MAVRSKLSLLRNDLEVRLDAHRAQVAPRDLELKLRSLRLDLEGKVVSTYEAQFSMALHCFHGL